MEVKKREVEMIEMIETEIESDSDSAWMSCLITIRIKVNADKESGDLLVESPQSVYSIFGCIIRLEESYLHVILNGDGDKLEQHWRLL